jgi:hypothetical protein
MVAAVPDRENLVTWPAGSLGGNEIRPAFVIHRYGEDILDGAKTLCRLVAEHRSVIFRRGCADHLIYGLSEVSRTPPGEYFFMGQDSTGV